MRPAQTREKRQRSRGGAFRETRSGRPGRSRGTTIFHQPEDPCGSAIDRAILHQTLSLCTLPANLAIPHAILTPSPSQSQSPSPSHTTGAVVSPRSAWDNPPITTLCPSQGGIIRWLWLITASILEASSVVARRAGVVGWQRPQRSESRSVRCRDAGRRRRVALQKQCSKLTACGDADRARHRSIDRDRPALR